MPENEKLVIELELEGRKFQKEMSTQLKAITQWSKQSAKSSQSIVKVLEEIKDALKDLSKGYKQVGTAAQEAGKKQAQASKQATEELKKQEGYLKKIKELASKAAKHDVGTGFAGGLMQGTGIAGAYRSMTGPNAGQRLGGAIGRGAVGVAARGVGFGISGVQNAYQTFLQYGQARYGMTGLGTTKDFSRGMKGAGGRLGFTPTESAAMGAGVARATGGLRSVGMAQQLALAGGFGPGGVGEAVSLMGTMRQAGSGFQGGQNQQARRKDFSKMIALGMESGLEKARLPEFFAGVGGLVRSQFATAAGKVDANVIAKQLAELGMSGKAGFQGARGAQVMGQLDAMIRRPGGGEAGQAMILQAMGFGKPGSKVNYYEAVKRQQEGIRDPDNVKRVMKEVYKQHGDVAASGGAPVNQQANLIMARMSGLSLKQVEELKNIYDSNITSKEKQEKIKELMEKAEPIDKQALRVSQQGFAGVKKHLAGIEGMQIFIGGKAAPFMMALQKAQLQLLKEMIKWIQPLSNWLMENHKALIGMAVDIKRWVTGGTEEEALKAISENTDKVINKLYKEKTTNVGQMIQQQAELATAYEKNRAERTKTVLDMPGIFGAMSRFVPGGGNFKQRLSSMQAVGVSQQAISARFAKSQMAEATKGLQPWAGSNEAVVEATRRVKAAALEISPAHGATEEQSKKLAAAKRAAKEAIQKVQGGIEGAAGAEVPTAPVRPRKYAQEQGVVLATGKANTRNRARRSTGHRGGGTETDTK